MKGGFRDREMFSDLPDSLLRNPPGFSEHFMHVLWTSPWLREAELCGRSFSSLLFALLSISPIYIEYCNPSSVLAGIGTCFHS